MDRQFEVCEMAYRVTVIAQYFYSDFSMQNDVFQTNSSFHIVCSSLANASFSHGFSSYCLITEVLKNTGRVCILCECKVQFQDEGFRLRVAEVQDDS